MIEISLALADLATIRFVRSPLLELLVSLRPLKDAHRTHLYRRWFGMTIVNSREIRRDVPMLMAFARKPAEFLLPNLGPHPRLDDKPAISVTRRGVAFS